MMHASIRAVGEVAGGPDEIHLAIKDAVAEAGTMFMYASCPRYPPSPRHAVAKPTVA